MKISNVDSVSAEFNGVRVHYLQMTAAQEAAWQEEKALARKPAPRTRKAKKRNGGGSAPASKFQASQVLARCMLAQISRANDIPFDGAATNIPAYIHQADEYGVE